MAALMFAVMIMIDLTLRPSRLVKKGVAFIVVTGIAVVITRESLLDAIWDRDIGLLPVLLSVLTASLVGYRYRPLRKFCGYCSKKLSLIKGAILNNGDIMADIIVMILLWTVTLPIAACIILVQRDWYTFHFFWGGLHGRILAMVQPCIVCGLILHMINRANVGVRAMRANRVSSIVSVGVIMVCVTTILPLLRAADESLLNRMVLGHVRLEEQTVDLSWEDKKRNEAIIFYSMAKSIDTRENVMAELFN